MAKFTITETRETATTWGPPAEINLSLKAKAEPDHIQEIRVRYHKGDTSTYIDLTAEDANALIDGLQHFIKQIDGGDTTDDATAVLEDKTNELSKRVSE